VWRITLYFEISLNAVLDSQLRVKYVGMLFLELVESFNGSCCKSIPPVAEAS
jgi:hypothetical protein